MEHGIWSLIFMLTHNNWFQHSWRKGGYKPKDILDNWILEFDTSDLDATLNFKESVEKALNYIKEKNKKLVLMYSGGLDSEIILKTAIDLGIDIIPYTMRYYDSDKLLNVEDITYVNHFAEKNNIEVKFVDVDIVDWYKNADYPHGYCWFVENTSATHVGTPLCCWLRIQIEKLEGDCCVIQGQGDCPLNLVPNQNNLDELNWVVMFNWEGHYRRFWWYEENYPDDVSQFFFYIPELQYNYLMEPIMQHCVKPNSLKCAVTSSRHAVYHYYWPELDRRKKYTGFEHFNEIQSNDLFPNKEIKYTPKHATGITSYTHEDYLRKF